MVAMGQQHGHAESQGGRLERVRGERDTFAALAFCWADLVFTLDRDLEITFVRGATRHYLGRDARELKGRSILDLVAADDDAKLADVFETSRRYGRIDRTQVHVRGPLGEYIAMAMSGYTLDPDRGAFYLALRGMTPDDRANDAEARRDSESGLFEAGAFAEVAAHRAVRARDAGETVEMSLVEIPEFAEATARMSEPAREGLARRIGETVRLRSVAGDTATCVGQGRYGVLHRSDHDLHSIEQTIAELTRQADPAGRTPNVRARSMPMDDIANISESDLVRGLTFMLSRYSHANGEGVSLTSLSSSMSDLVDQAVHEVSGFKQTVASGNFGIVVQPIVGARNGAIHHYEALCRFHQSNNGASSPFQQIRFAEETGLIHEFDLAMARHAVNWLAKQPRDMPGLKIAVNVSGSSAGTEAYVRGLHELLEANTWARGRLLFEITESARMSDLQSADRFIQSVRERGFPVCLDDLGAGAASFRYLSALTVDYVKLDGKAIAHARGAEKGKAFLSALVELCHRLGTKTIAEMIDDVEGLDFVRACGVDYVQGFLFGRPSSKLNDFAPLPNGNVFRTSAASKTSRSWTS
jgi:EAL domain-containing protein (putative c-di-GMP-specific phosphodiesterase class I)/PAS domain-containing protein